MTRLWGIGGGLGAAFIVCGAAFAADAKKQGTQPPPSRPQVQQNNSGSQPRVQAHNNDASAEARRQADFFRAKQAAMTAKAAAALGVPQTSSNPPSTDNGRRNWRGSDGRYPYGYGYGYRPYGYGYGNPYVPYGTTPYVASYDPYSGATYISPYEGGYLPPSYANSPYGYSPYAYSPYGYYRNPYLGVAYPGAVFADASQLYGPGPIQRLMGVNPYFSQRPNFAAAAGAYGPAPAAGSDNVADNHNANAGFANGNQGRAAAAEKPARKAPGAKAQELAWKFITFGDAQFGNLKYSDALDRYRRAARECPTLGDAWFREGFAFAAMGSYDAAAKAMRRGLEAKPDWADANFRLDDIYGNNADDKRAAVAAMVKAAEAEPTNGDLALVVGVHLYSEGKLDQAAPFFRRAVQILGEDAGVQPFLAKLQE